MATIEGRVTPSARRVKKRCVGIVAPEVSWMGGLSTRADAGIEASSISWFNRYKRRPGIRAGYFISNRSNKGVGLVARQVKWIAWFAPLELAGVIIT